MNTQHNDVFSPKIFPLYLPSRDIPEVVRASNVDFGRAVIVDIPSVNERYGFADVVRVVDRNGRKEADGLIESSPYATFTLLHIKGGGISAAVEAILDVHKFIRSVYENGKLIAIAVEDDRCEEARKMQRELNHFGWKIFQTLDRHVHA